MPQSNVIFSALIIAFVIYIAGKNELGTYLNFLTGGGSTSATPGATDNSSSSGGMGGLSGGSIGGGIGSSLGSSIGGTVDEISGNKNGQDAALGSQVGGDVGQVAGDAYTGNYGGVAEDVYGDAQQAQQ